MSGELRWCSACRSMRPVWEFRPNEAMVSGLHPWCRQCVSDYAREWREANRGYVEAYNADRRAEYAAARGPLERTCANPECGRTFTPSRRDAKTCTQKCRSRYSHLRRQERRS